MPYHSYRYCTPEPVKKKKKKKKKKKNLLTDVQDLKSDNVLMALRDQSVLDTVVQDEMSSPLPQKKLEDQTIYLSRNDFGLQAKDLGRPVITDFGLAVRGDEPCTYNHPIQPDGYQAPEVVLRAGWSYSVDIWNLGTLVFIAQIPLMRKPCELISNPDLGSAPRKWTVRSSAIWGVEIFRRNAFSMYHLTPRSSATRYTSSWKRKFSLL